VTFVRSPCPHTEIGSVCAPKNSKCENGVRMIPVQAIDVAGLVAGAHLGRGRGNQFLDDLRQANALVHVVDASGETDGEGNLVGVGEHDPREDIAFLEDEVAYWIKSIIDRGWSRVSRQIDLEGMKVEVALQERLAGLGVTVADVTRALDQVELGDKVVKWSEEEMLELSKRVREISKPIIIAANKADKAPPDMLKSLLDVPGATVIPTSAECELALRRAARAGLITYMPGEKDFTIDAPDKLNEAQRKGLERIRGCVSGIGGTGVQRIIEEAVFNLLQSITVYPVEDETHWSDKKGNVLPDAYLVRRGSTAKDLAFRVHTDLGDKFIRAMNARTHRVVGATYELQDRDVIKIVSG
jgi:ribosome-binding ATPase YchF (GTP1/OBG family)